MAPLQIDKTNFETVFETVHEYYPAFLDTETWRVIVVDDYMDSVIDELCEADVSLAEVMDPVYEALFVKEEETLNALGRTLLDELNTRSRYYYIQPQGSNEGYRDMILFARSAEDDELRQALLIALDGRGAFRRFKDVLLGYPEQRDEWFAFKEERLTQRMRDWCESIGVDATFV